MKFNKHMLDFAYFYKIIFYFLRKFKNFHLFNKELYARWYNFYMFEALSLLVF